MILAVAGYAFCRASFNIDSYEGTMLVRLEVMLYVIFSFFLFYSSAQLLRLSRMVGFPYHRYLSCFVTDNHIHSHRLHYTVILLRTDDTHYCRSEYCCDYVFVLVSGFFPLMGVLS
jgi:hypothetical protein